MAGRGTVLEYSTERVDEDGVKVSKTAERLFPGRLWRTTFTPRWLVGRQFTQTSDTPVESRTNASVWSLYLRKSIRKPDD
jgi:hypothetical protein